MTKEIFEPIQIIWHVGNTCDACCKYCFTSASFSDQAISNTTWKTVVDRINREKSITKVSIIGGEPLLVNELPLIIQNLRKDILTNVDSNLTNIKNRWDPTFKQTVFSTTVDDINDDINFKTRGHSAQKTIKGVKFLLNKGIKIQVIIVVTTHNIGTLEKTAKYFLDLGVERVGISKVRMVGRAWNFGCEYFYEDVEAIKEKTAKVVKKLIDSYGKERVLVYSLWHDKKFFDLGYEYEPSCKCALFRASIDWDGFMYPCELMPFYWKDFEKTYGLERPDLKEVSISQAFNSELFKFFREGMLSYPVGCESCTYKDICNHGCRFYAFLTSTVLLAKDTTCGTNSVYDALGYHHFSPLSTHGRKRWKTGKAMFLKEITNVLGRKVYDLNCGGGLWTFFLEDLGKQVIGIDSDRTMMLIAKEYKDLNNRRSDFVLANPLTYAYKKADSAVLLDNKVGYLSPEEILKLLKKLKNKVKVFVVEVDKKEISRGIRDYRMGPFDIKEEITKVGRKYKRKVLNKQTGAKFEVAYCGWGPHTMRKVLKDFGDVVIEKDIDDSYILALKFK